MNLVIVESPAKAKTIEKYLGEDYKVVASVGHIIDLPNNELGVDIKNNFEPKYQVIEGKEKVISSLKKSAKTADKIYLAPDPDREGEAIAWHISNELKRDKDISRVLFNEITKKGVLDGIKNPMAININRVNAQQSRRILDRLVGYLVSPILWKQLKSGLSAGRVQSVALKMICDREKEIESFIPVESWSINSIFTIYNNDGIKGDLKSKLDKIEGKKANIQTEDEAINIIKQLPDDFAVTNVEKKDVKQSPTPSFITSKLQQEAIRKLSFTSKKTMSVAQSLYEGVDLGVDGPMGLITYMRTDSIRVSPEAVAEAEKFIKETYGAEFYNGYRFKDKKSGKNIQDAHEAIRPTSIHNTPDKVKKFLTVDQYKLYKLIWERFVASVMTDAIYTQTTITVEKDIYLFKSTGRIQKFAGFTTIYSESKEDENGEDDDEDSPILFDITKEDNAKLKNTDKKQHFTQSPPRFTESSLVKILEQEGIGRPSTYASIISVIIDRKYTELKQKKFYPTELGRIVNNILISNFKNIFDTKFTADMEEELDKIEDGEENWKDVLSKFYVDFDKELTVATEGKVQNDIKTDIVCPECSNGSLSIKYGKNGTFLACSNYPTCKFTSNFERNAKGEVILLKDKVAKGVGIICEKCGKELVMKSSRYGEIIACPGYPSCKNIKNFLTNTDGSIRVIESGEKIGDSKCPTCSSDLVVKAGKNGLFVACSGYPNCKYTANIKLNDDGSLSAVPANKRTAEEINEVCEKCGKPMVMKRTRRGPFLACSGYPDCKNAKSLKK